MSAFLCLFAKSGRKTHAWHFLIADRLSADAEIIGVGDDEGFKRGFCPQKQSFSALADLTHVTVDILQRAS